MKWESIQKIANDLKKYVEKNKKVPSKIEGLKFQEYSYIMVCGVINPGEADKVQSLLRDAPNPHGDPVAIKASKSDFTQMAKDVKNFMKPNARLPNYVVISKKKVDIRLAIYGFAKIISFYGKEKRMPKTCEFNSSAFSKKSSGSKSTTKKYSTKGGKVCQKLANLAKMDINNYKDVYKAIGKIFTYDFYFNDEQTQAQTISRKKGNCTDLNQVERAALIEIYGNDKVQIVRGLVKCNDGKTYGHVWCRIKVNGKWVNIDASAAAKGKSLGEVICAKVVEITNINPSWAVSDDGRT